MWFTVNGLRSETLEDLHVNLPVAGFRTNVAELTAVNPLSPELKARLTSLDLALPNFPNVT